MKKRIYVCHTYYHVYVSFLKELFLPRGERKKATLVLSKMSNDFEDLKSRVEKSGIFEEVIEFDEKREDYFPDLAKYRKDKGNIVFNMLARIQFTRKYARLEAPFVPVDFKNYKDIYVFCDSDPIGYYLNQSKIKYHALEDGLNTIVHSDDARYDNRGCFRLKVLMSKLNLIFIQNGYGKYCLDMEVNNISDIKYDGPKYIEVPRRELEEHLTDEDKQMLLDVFVRDIASLKARIEEGSDKENKVLILTEPLCALTVREQIFKDLVELYSKDALVFLKPHPRDVLDYEKLFPTLPIIDKTVPMELLNYLPDVHFTKVVSVFTETAAIHFAKESVRLGPDFMDKYEEPSVHRQNEQI